MTSDEYLWSLLAREAVDVSSTSPVRQVQGTLYPLLAEWAGNKLRGIYPSGSFAKGTANHSGTDIDLLVSLSNDVTETLKEVYTKLHGRLKEKGYDPKQQNVSINIRVDGYDVDLVPAKHQGGQGEDHSLYKRRADTWIKTNFATHIAKVQGGNRIGETRIVKLWRNQKGLDFPSFNLELAVIAALFGKGRELSGNVWNVFGHLRDTFPTARFVDPANSNNIVSDDLSADARAKIKAAAERALAAKNWNEIVV